MMRKIVKKIMKRILMKILMKILIKILMKISMKRININLFFEKNEVLCKTIKELK